MIVRMMINPFINGAVIFFSQFLKVTANSIINNARRDKFINYIHNSQELLQ